MPDNSGAASPASEQSTTGATIDDLYLEERQFPAPEGFRAQAVVQDDAIYSRSAGDAPAFWAEQAETLDWFEKWTTVLEWDLPFARWFVGGTLNVSYNCLDRHVAAGLGDRVAYHFEGEPGDTKTITYGGLLADVERFANVLKGLGVVRGDVVAIYMPMVPELPTAMLACTRWAPPTRLSSGDSPLKRCATGSTTPRPRWSSPPTAAGVAARWCR